jgi:dihydrofolate synthase/folylpolyglutamate synthase
MVSVITNVSFDHMQFLGDSLEKIAAEKAGIIKPGIPVVAGETQEESAPVFLRKAAECGAEIMFADRRFRAEIPATASSFPEEMLTVDIYRDGMVFLEGLTCPLTGLYQRKNLVTVAGVCEVLEKCGIAVSAFSIRKGISGVVKNTGFAGRWQVIGRKPLTIADTGHNEGGLKEVMAQLAATPHSHLHFVFGVVNDKHLAPILGLLPRNATYYYCRPDIPRGLDAGELKRQAEKSGMEGECYPSVKHALAAARYKASDDDLVFVGGSTFVVAEVV